jgi:hypothetical protein
MEEARRIDGEVGVTVRYIEAAAEDTGFPEAHFEHCHRRTVLVLVRSTTRRE